MNILRKVTYLMLAVLAIFLLPWLGSWLRYKGAFPRGFFTYPPTGPLPKAPFSLLIFALIAGLGGVLALLYLFPRWFGFRSVRQDTPPHPKVGWPFWFWVGLVSWGVTLLLLLMRATQPGWLLHWSDLPLFWGFAMMLDGWVYVRTGGRSLISEVPQEVVGIGVSSTLGWMLFEYLNFFVDDNWYYPKSGIISQEQFLLYAIVISSGLLPVAFEWYSLFKTVPALRNRFSAGLKLVLPEWIKTALLLLSLAGLFGSGLFPDTLFFALWLAPVVLLAAVLDKVGVWTPLRPIGQGNWTPTLLFALTYLVEGLCLEGQNYLTGEHVGREVVFTEDPTYWQYDLPYVNVLHLFEMPLLGFLGYLPFGVYCWVWWITFATLVGIPSRFYKEAPFEHNPTD